MLFPKTTHLPASLNVGIYEASPVAAADGEMKPVSITPEGYIITKDANAPSAIPSIYNIVLTSADTEYSQALPANAKGFSVQVQGNNAARMAFVTGKVATPTAPYRTIKAGQVYESFDGSFPGTLYFASGTGGSVIELVVYT